MFHSVSDQIRRDDLDQLKTSERYLRWLLVLVVSTILFGALYLGVRMLE
jgi:hypothetical protein